MPQLNTDCTKKSDSYYRRLELMNKLEVPMMSEILEELGESLADVFFHEVPEALKPDLGIEPKLSGCKGELWISPSDILIGKVVLKPPLSSRYIRALTHEGIIEIGTCVEQKFLNEMNIEKEKALKEQAELLNFIAEKRLNHAIEKVTEELTRMFEEKVRELMNDFELRLAEELARLESELREEFAKTLKAQEEELAKQWKLKLVHCVKDTVNLLTEQYLMQLKKKEEELQAHYELNIEREKTRLQITLEVEEKHCEFKLNHLKHNLECQSIANMMYILCMERKKYQAEINAVENRYKEEVAQLENVCKLRQEEINSLSERLNNARIKLSLREEFLLEIIRQFQKFINFALRATPTQAEFLLSVEKMMLFELTATLERFTSKSLEFDGHILSWKSDSNLSKTVTSLQAPDYHKCHSQTSEPISDPSREILPAFYYNNKLYVREDFRNMASQNITLSRSNLLWNKDVENLMIILRRSVEKITTEESCTLSESAKRQSASNTLIIPMKQSHSITSSAHLTKNRSQEKDQRSFRYSDIHRVSVKGDSLLDTDFKGLVDSKKKDKETAATSERLGLLATSDSLTKYRSSLSGKRKISECGACFSVETNYSDSISPLEKVRKILSFSYDSEIIETEGDEYEESLEDCVCEEKEEMNENKLDFSVPHTSSKPVSNISFNSNISKSKKPQESRQSKLSLHVDSLELLKKQLKDRKQSIETKGSSKVRISTLPYKDKLLPVPLSEDRADVYTINDSPWKLYSKTSVKSKDSKIANKIKEETITGIAGDKLPKEHIQESKDFTVDRISSIMKILNNNPSLLRMFTGCTLNH